MRCIALNAPQTYNPISPPSQNANERKSEGLAWIFARGILLPEGLERREAKRPQKGEPSLWALQEIMSGGGVKPAARA